MRRIFFDTNVLVYYLMGVEGPGEDATRLLDLAQAGNHALFVASLSLKDVYYTICNLLKRQERAEKGQVEPAAAVAASRVGWASVRHVMEFAQVVSVGRAECLQAFAYERLHGDFEDDLVLAAAAAARADLLVTCDDALLRHSPLPALSPADALVYLEGL